MSGVAVVTGGASGIGLGVARGFVADGHRVALLDGNRSAAKAAADELAAEGGTAVAVEVDVADGSSVDSARASTGPTTTAQQ
jgi:NAD(P)-dependent dehydrogenase (short-subunit alcohol dehydrogenase family)